MAPGGGQLARDGTTVVFPDGALCDPPPPTTVRHSHLSVVRGQRLPVRTKEDGPGSSRRYLGRVGLISAHVGPGRFGLTCIRGQVAVVRFLGGEGAGRAGVLDSMNRSGLALAGALCVGKRAGA